MIPFDLHYQWPQAAYLLPISLLILCLYGWLALFREKALEKFAPADSIRQYSIARSRGIFWSKAIAVSLAWACGVLSLMQPVGNGHYPEGGLPQLPEKNDKSQKFGIKRKAHDVIFLIDASASMSVQDSRLGKSRLDYAKDIAESVVSNLNGESASLHAFTSLPTQLSPLTLDYLFIRLMLKDIHINEGDTPGTNIVKALADIRKQYFSNISPKMKTLIILSDGGDTAIDSMQGNEKEKAIESASSILGDAEKLQLRVYTIGIGSPAGQNIPEVEYRGSPVKSGLEEEFLHKLAIAGRGNYYKANDYTPLDLAKEIIQQMNQDPQYYQEDEMLVQGNLMQSLASDSGLVYDRYFQIPLGLALLFLIFVILCPDAIGRKEVYSLE